VTVTKTQLQASVGSLQFFTLSFGVIVGVGWVTILGSWLLQAGPLGAALGLTAGGLLMIVIGLCYAEMVGLVPASGGEMAFAYEAFGAETFFVTGWLLGLSFIAAIAFEAISLGWVVGAIVPGVEGPTMYSVLGGPVRAGTSLLAIGGIAVLTWLNVRGVRAAARLQDVLILAFIAFASIFLGAALLRGRVANLQPYLHAEGSGSRWGGGIAIFMTASFWFAGFSVVPQLMGEKAPATPLRNVGRVMVLSIAAAVAFKVLVVIAASMTMPWQQLAVLPLPAATAFRVALGSPALAILVLVTGLVGLLSALNSCLISASRVLYSLGRARMLSSAVSRVHPRYGSPVSAIAISAAIALVGAAAGKKAIIPIVNVSSTGLAFAFLVTCLAVIRLRRRAPQRERPFRVPGGTLTAWVGVAGSLISLLLSLYQPWKDAGGGVPLEWIVLGAWVALGALLWMVGGHSRLSMSEDDRRAVILPSLEA
jgi:APA family basic amino acid/polyamine antiporter